MKSENLQYETKILTTKYPKPDAYGALSMPVYYTASFEFPSARAMSDAFCGRSPAPSYSRIANPTVSHLEERVRQWTGATSVTALNTGMAAITYALTAVSAAGLNVVASKHLFGNSVSLLQDTLGSFGVEVRFADFTCLDEVVALIDSNTCGLFFEIITNPQLFVADINALADIAHEHAVPLIAPSFRSPRSTPRTGASTSRWSAARSTSPAEALVLAVYLSTTAPSTGAVTRRPPFCNASSG